MEGTNRIASLCSCPVCRSELTWLPERVDCRGCVRSYEIQGGIPILLPEEGGPTLAETWYPGAKRLIPARLLPFFERHRSFFRPDMTRKFSTKLAVERFVASFHVDASILNVGGGEKDYGSNVLNLDVEPAPSVDVVGIAERLPFRSASFDGVILQAVLEHVQDAASTLNEIRRVLVPGGMLLIEVPFIQGYHPGPGDYRRYTEQGLRAEVEAHGFQTEESGIAVGPASAMAWVLAEFLALLVSGRSATGFRLARLVTRWIAAPVKYADVWLEKHPMAYTIPSGVWVRARRAADGAE